MRNQNRPIFRSLAARGIMLAAIATALVLTQPSLASGDDVREHPGYVEGEQFVQLIDPDGDLIEVNLDKKLLKLFTGRAKKRHDNVISAIFSDLVAVNAVIGEVSRHREDVEAEMQRIRSNVEREGWERFVRVREDEQEFTAYIHADEEDEEEVDGLLVIGFHEGGDEMLFVNLAGRIDMERIALLGERMGLPGLDDLPPMSEVERQREAQRNGEEEADATEDKDTAVAKGGAQ